MRTTRNKQLVDQVSSDPYLNSILNNSACCRQQSFHYLTMTVPVRHRIGTFYWCSERQCNVTTNGFCFALNADTSCSDSCGTACTKLRQAADVGRRANCVQRTANLSDITKIVLLARTASRLLRTFTRSLVRDRKIEATPINTEVNYKRCRKRCFTNLKHYFN